MKRYALVALQVSGGTPPFAPTATVSLLVDGDEVRESAVGSGMVDAAFRAVSRVVEIAEGHNDIALESYSVVAVSPGSNAMGRVDLKIRWSNLIAYGRGEDADVVVASTKALVDALDRMGRGEYDPYEQDLTGIPS